jgi:hypothetical protein
METVKTELDRWFSFGEDGFRVSDASGTVIGLDVLIGKILQDHSEIKIECGHEVRQRLLLCMPNEAWRDFGLDDNAGRLQAVFPNARFFQWGNPVLTNKLDLLRTVDCGEALWVERPPLSRGISAVAVNISSPDEIQVNILLLGRDEITTFLLSTRSTVEHAIHAAREALAADISRNYVLEPLGGGRALDIGIRLIDLPPPLDFVLVEPISFDLTQPSGQTISVSARRGEKVGEIARRFGKTLVTNCGVALNPDEEIFAVVEKYGSTLGIAGPLHRVDVHFLNGTSRVIEMVANASVRLLKRAIACEYQSVPSDVDFQDDQGRLDDNKSIVQICGRVRCSLSNPVAIITKPPNYAEALAKLMRLSGIKRRSVERCLNFHDYDYEAALADLMNSSA